MATDGLAQPIAMMGISPAQEQVINKACTGAVGPIQVRDLDKGLSGARVLLAQWPLRAETRSALHVLKIHDDVKKLELESQQIETYVAPVDPQIGHIRLFCGQGCGLLRQAFIGSPDGALVSLRNWFEASHDPAEARQQIRCLFEDRLRQWHCIGDCSPPTEKHRLEDIFEGRTERIDALSQVVKELGVDALEHSLDAWDPASFRPLQETLQGIERLRFEYDDFPIGLVHGDLHAQNVLIGPAEQVHLIDFAWAGYRWKAVDFLMMECSLKFLAAPMDARDTDLLEMERLIEDNEAESRSNYASLSRCLHGERLRVFGAAVEEIRRQARRCRAFQTFDQYRRGLIVLTACLATYPQLNRSYLVHSLAFHVSRL